MKRTNSDKAERMEKIEEEILSFKASPLYEYRVSNGYFPVIGEGSLDASIVFVGEAPGKNEALQARPFCGRSGKMLDEMLATIGLDRKKVYITNLVKDRPPENRDPSPEEIRLYSPFLDRQLEIVQPKVVVMLGRLSMNYLFRKAGIEDKLASIGKMHGMPFQGDFGYGTVQLLPLYHPAAALYNPKMKSVLFEDFKKVSSFI
jgi:uracil-DNA glycosylase